MVDRSMLFGLKPLASEVEFPYVVIRDRKVVRQGFAAGAEAAYTELKPDPEKGEKLYIEVGRSMV